MSSTAPAKRELNPFAFAAETDALFILLMISAVLLAAQLSRVMIHLFAPQLLAEFQALDLLAMVRGEVLSQTRTAILPLLYVPAVLTGMIFGVALLIYRSHPARIRQRKKLLLLTGKDVAVQQAVDDLARGVGITSLPVVEMPAGLQGASGQAFGLRDNYRMRLDGGLRIWRRIKTKQSWFRAVVLHELAHIANGDVWRSYFAEALWQAMVLISIVPLVVGLCGIVGSGIYSGLLDSQRGLDIGVLFNALLSLLGTLFKIGVTLAVIAAIRARLLYTREVYADSRAAIWGAANDLKERFKASIQTEKDSPGIGFWRLHPTSFDRLTLLNQPNRLFRLSPALPFLIGFLSAFVLSGALLLLLPFFMLVLEPIRIIRIELGNLYQANPGMLISLQYWLARIAWFLLFIAGLIGFFGPIVWLISSVFGRQIQKLAVLDITEARRGFAAYLRLLIPAGVLIAGMLFGFWIAPFSPFTLDSFTEFIAEFILMLAMTALIWWYLAYGRFISLRLFSPCTGQKSPVWRMRLISWLQGIWLFLFFLPGLILALIISNSLEEVWVVNLMPVFAGWLVIVAILGVISFGASWLLAKLLRVSQQPRCPSCKQLSKDAQPAVATCRHCGHTLGEWLLMPKPVPERET